MRKESKSVAEPQSGQIDREDFAEPYHTTSATTRQQICNHPAQNSLKLTVKRIIEKRLEKYSDIIFDVNTDWLEEIIIDGSRCIIIDLDSIDTEYAEILSKMQLYTGTHKSITQRGRQILFIGYA